MVKINADGTRDTSFPAEMFDGPVRAMARDGSKIVCVGEFVTYTGESLPGTPQWKVARINADGTLDALAELEGVGPDNTVLRVLVPPVGHPLGAIPAIPGSGHYVIAGRFNNIQGMARSKITAIYRQSGEDQGALVPPIINGDILALGMQSSGKFIIGGEFTTVGGVARVAIARLNVDGSHDTTFNAAIPSGKINALTIDADDRIIIGGTFLSVGGVARAALARLLPDGALDESWNVQTEDTVTEVAAHSDGTVFIGGQFVRVSDLLAIVGELPTEGTTRHGDGELVAVIKTGVRRKVDADVLARIAPSIPEAIGKRLLRWKPDLVTSELRYVQNNEPEIYAVLAEAITVTPAKPTIRIEAAKQKEAA